MPKKKKDRDSDARNQGVEKRAEELREPGQHPPREGQRPGPAVPDPATERHPAATEHLENPPQVEGPRERSNDEAR